MLLATLNFFFFFCLGCLWQPIDLSHKNLAHWLGRLYGAFWPNLGQVLPMLSHHHRVKFAQIYIYVHNFLTLCPKCKSQSSLDSMGWDEFNAPYAVSAYTLPYYISCHLGFSFKLFFFSLLHLQMYDLRVYTLWPEAFTWGYATYDLRLCNKFWDKSFLNPFAYHYLSNVWIT